MTTEDMSFDLQLHPNWGFEATSENRATLQQEVVELLTKAPNVDDFLPITDGRKADIIGYLIILKDGERITALASLRDRLYFDGAYNVLPAPHDFVKQDYYRVIYSPLFAKGDELPYDQDVPTAEEAYDWWLKDMRGDTSTFRRMEKRSTYTSDWTTVQDA